MNKSYLIVFLCFFLYKAGYAQSKLFVAINNQECVNCLGFLYYLNKIDSNIPLKLIFEKRYQRDSAALIKRLHLASYSTHILWSDSLYQKFRNRGPLASALSLYNPTNGKTLKTGLIKISENLPFINSINNKADTIITDQPIFSAESNFGNSGSYFYNFDGLRKEMRVFNKINHKFLYTLSLSDSLAKVAFQMRFGTKWQNAYQQMTTYTSRWQTVDPQAYCAYYYSNDTVYLLAQHHYMIYPADGVTDTSTTVFLSLSMYKGSKLVDFSLVENYIDPKLKGKNRGIRRVDSNGSYLNNDDTYYILSGPFTIYQHDPYFLMVGGLFDNAPNHFLAKYYYDNRDHTYKYGSLYRGTLPKTYDSVGYNNLHPAYIIPSYSPYVSLCLSDHFFSLNKEIPDIFLDFFPVNNGPNDKIIWSIKIAADNAYMIYMNNQDYNYYYLKYDLKNKKIIINRPICNFKDSSFITTPSIDDFDYDYVLVPLSYDSILRKKMTI